MSVTVYYVHYPGSLPAVSFVDLGYPPQYGCLDHLCRNISLILDDASRPSTVLVYPGPLPLPLFFLLCRL